jgi:hypothetical protein
MNTFPLALSKKLEGEGERFAGWRSWAANDLECEVGLLRGPPDRTFLPGHPVRR